MRKFLPVLFLVPAIFLLYSCSAISPQIKSEAVKPSSFSEVVENVDAYLGKTILVGGYILETTNLPNTTRIAVLQTPLSYLDEPLSKDRSEGRFIVEHDDFLDPEVYQKDRALTVAGIVKGTELRQVDESTYTYVIIRNLELHLWPEPQYVYPVYPAPVYFYWWYYPYPYYRYYPYYYHYYPFHPHRYRYHPW